jgi:hypothetical protein
MFSLSVAQVSVVAKQVDFRLSTPRTRWDIRSLPEKKHIAPVVFSLMDINLAVVDPIVPACYLFDRVRYAPPPQPYSLELTSSQRSEHYGWPNSISRRRNRVSHDSQRLPSEVDLGPMLDQPN